MQERGLNGNGGWKIQNWSQLWYAVRTVGVVLGLIIGGMLWGLKLDHRSFRNMERITVLETRSDARPDPFTGNDAIELEQRLQRQIDALRRQQ